MIVQFFDRQDGSNPLNGTSIREASKLREILDSFQNRKPFFCELLCENGYKLLVGPGGEIGSIQFSRIDGNPPYMMAVAASMQLTTDRMEYLIGDTPTEVPARYCLPIGAVKEIALHFQNTGDRSHIVPWQEI